MKIRSRFNEVMNKQESVFHAKIQAQMGTIE